MKKLLITAGLAALCAGPAFSQEDALKVQQAFNAVAAAARPAVVSIKVLREEVERVVAPEFYFGHLVPVERYYKYDSGGLGSGVLVDPAGYVLTNEHVVGGADRIQVIMKGADGREKKYVAEVAASDQRLDLAVLRIRSKDKFPALKFAEGPAKVGDWALAVGYPFGFRQTMTSGIVSATDLSMRIQGRRYARLLQTDAAINQGNSGGPLLNLKGEIIGINSAIFSPSGAFAGMGFAIPAQEARRAYEEFLGLKPARRGWLGVALAEMDPAAAARLGVPAGAMVARVMPGSPAQAARLRRGDIVVTFDGEEVQDEADLLSFIYSRKPGDKVELGYYRGGAVNRAQAVLGEQQAAPAAKEDFDY
ncbi:MAG: trypsin-like peptidase domain-containing protein [Elusimicrobiales bacterium]|nr:trypsin-like peptidase domain-containing protein [Elusimicrobiales bacterium]